MTSSNEFSDMTLPPMSAPDASEKAHFDLDAYCRRVGYDGVREPTLETLRAIHRLHPQAIPFENLDVVLRRPVAIDAASLQRKLIAEGRGGYCFEQNMLLSLAFNALGFAVTALTARVRFMVPEHVVMPLTHMLLKVDVGGEAHIADVGFGANTMTGPLRLISGLAQETPHEPFRLTETDGRWLAEVKVREVWTPLYRFSLEPQHRPDLDLGNWFMSTHPKSRFYNDLVVSRVRPEGRLALNNNQLTVHSLSGASERRVLETESELRAALTGLFGLTLPDDPGLFAALNRIASGAV
jgi:N-hydroxyarylamine O-acetyltransferase